VLLGAFAGAQWTAVPAAIEIGLTAVRVPLAAWLVGRGWGVESVWFAIASTTVVKGTILAGLFGVRYGRGRPRDD
jgi:Na+-driven multidrug efflux pump